jgi:hypothetical protein
MGATNLANIAITIILAATNAPGAGFGMLMIFPLADCDLDGDRVRTYASVAEAQADEDDGFLSSDAVAAITVAFSQSPPPISVKIANIDLVGLETYAAALTAIQAVDDDWFAVGISSRVAADLSAMATACEALDKLFVGQANTAGILTGSFPAGLSALVGKDHTALIYDLADADWADAAWMGAKLAFNPDDQSVDWAGALKGTTDYSDTITTTERNYAIANNANLILPYSASQPFWIDPGVVMSGKPVYEILTAIWLKIRLRERIADLVARYSSLGWKIPLNATGQQAIKGEIDAQFAIAQANPNARHITAGQYVCEPQAITAGDITARKLRFKVRAQIEGSARLFDVTVNLGREAVVTAGA